MNKINFNINCKMICNECDSYSPSGCILKGGNNMSVIFKRLNSEDTRFATWTTEDETNGNLPTKMPDGSDIPINNFGVNVQNLNVYYWDGNQWQPTE